jgi:hypothetical protein
MSAITPFSLVGQNKLFSNRLEASMFLLMICRLLPGYALAVQNTNLHCHEDFARRQLTGEETANCTSQELCPKYIHRGIIGYVEISVVSYECSVSIFNVGAIIAYEGSC